MRYVTKESIDGLVSKLGLPQPGPHSQDWEFEIADADRVTEWIDEYLQRDALTDDERFTLMIIILESYDDALRAGVAKARDWDKIAGALKRDHLLHRSTLEYWSLPEEEDISNVFHVTSLIRSLAESLRSEGKI